VSKVAVTSCSFYIKCSMCPPCWRMIYSSWRRHWPKAWSVKCCECAPLSDIKQDSVATHWRCGGIFIEMVLLQIYS